MIENFDSFHTANKIKMFSRRNKCRHRGMKIEKKSKKKYSEKCIAYIEWRNFIVNKLSLR